MSPRRLTRIEFVASIVCWVVSPLVAYLILQSHFIGLPLLLGILVATLAANAIVVAIVRFALSD